MSRLLTIVYLIYLFFFFQLKKFVSTRPYNHNSSDLVRILLLTIHVFMYLFVGSIIFIFLPSIVFTSIEDWDYVESIYFSFITLATIGFGDYVPGEYSNLIVMCLHSVDKITFYSQLRNIT